MLDISSFMQFNSANKCRGLAAQHKIEIKINNSLDYKRFPISLEVKIIIYVSFGTNESCSR